jgi:hypothetical protein
MKNGGDRACQYIQAPDDGHGKGTLVHIGFPDLTMMSPAMGCGALPSP